MFEHSRMKKFYFKFCLIGLFFSLANFSSYAQEEKQVNPLKPKIAVLDFESIGVEKHLGRGVAEILRVALIDSGEYTVVERAMLDKVFEEQKLQQTGSIDEKTAIELGKILGAETVVVGSIVKMGATYTITPRFIDVKTGEAKIAKYLTCEKEDDIPQICDELVAMITGKRDISLEILAAREKLVAEIRKLRDESDLLREGARREKLITIENKLKELQAFDQRYSNISNYRLDKKKQNVWRGVRVNNAERDKGVIVTDVVKNEPAYKAGLREGDVVISIGGKHIRNTEDYNEVIKDTKGNILIQTDKGYLVVKEENE